MFCYFLIIEGLNYTISLKAFFSVLIYFKIGFGYQDQNWNWRLGQLQLNKSMSSPSKHSIPSKLFSLTALGKNITPYKPRWHFCLMSTAGIFGFLCYFSCFLIYFSSVLLCWIYWSILKDIFRVGVFMAVSCTHLPFEGIKWHHPVSGRILQIPFFGIMEQYHCCF